MTSHFLIISDFADVSACNPFFVPEAVVVVPEAVAVAAEAVGEAADVVSEVSSVGAEVGSNVGDVGNLGDVENLDDLQFIDTPFVDEPWMGSKRRKRDTSSRKISFLEAFGLEMVFKLCLQANGQQTGNLSWKQVQACEV